MLRQQRRDADGEHGDPVQREPFDFPNHLSGPTAHRWIIIATQGYAALPGAPTPDYIMPDRFFEPDGDTLRYRSAPPTSSRSPRAQLPLDGVHSIDRALGTGNLTIIVNNPINFAGVEGSISVPPGIPIATPLLWLIGAGTVGAVGVARLRRRADSPRYSRGGIIGAPLPRP